jgi:microcystin-dependent protein
VAGGNAICPPPGQKCHVFFDGTDMDYVDTPPVGSALDLHGVTTIPLWIAQCSVRPYLLKDGTVYTSTLYPALAAMLGSTFGGNGVSTFGVPDERSRIRLAVDTGATGRITAAGSGINGTVMGATGGDQLLQSHNHTATDSGHPHAVPLTSTLANAGNNQAITVATPSQFNLNTATGTAIITVGNTGSGSSQNMPPTIVSFLPLIKT